MNNALFFRIAGTIAALGAVTAIASAVLYWMRLPIFDETSLAWTFVVGVLSTAIFAAAMIVRGIWEANQNGTYQ